MSDWLAIFIFAASTTLTPGPNNLMIMNSGLSFGFRKTLPHYFGICLGFPGMVLGVALGLGAIFTVHPLLKQTLEILGALYMLFLAWKIAHATATNNVLKRSKPLTFFQATMFQWINPKAWIMAITITSLFTLNTNYLINALLISLTCLVVCLPSAAIWCSAGKLLQTILKTPQKRQYFNWTMAGLMVFAIILIFIK